MHELALCEGLIRALDAKAAAEDVARIVSVRLEVGVLAAVDPQALSFAFAVIARGTAAEGARLDIVDTEGAAWCAACARRVRLRAFGDPCPSCGGHRLHVLGGTEIRIRDMEVI